MLLFKTNRRIIAAYGVGSGNAPTLFTCNGVGHLWAALLSILNITSYESNGTRCIDTCTRNTL